MRTPVSGRPEFAFEISGGNLCLDLANTRDRRPTPSPREHLHTYEDLVVWGLQAGAIEARQAAALRALARRGPGAARAALARALALREAIFDLFSAVAGGRALPAPALARLNAALPAALSRLELADEGRGPSWAWRDAPTHLDRVAWPAARAAALLVASDDRERVRECAARDCAWLFLDQSRNGTRRWCNMAVCGNREKARRFQGRARR